MSQSSFKKHLKNWSFLSSILDPQFLLFCSLSFYPLDSSFGGGKGQGCIFKVILSLNNIFLTDTAALISFVSIHLIMIIINRHISGPRVFVRFCLIIFLRPSTTRLLITLYLIDFTGSYWAHTYVVFHNSQNNPH